MLIEQPKIAATGAMTDTAASGPLSRTIIIRTTLIVGAMAALLLAFVILAARSADALAMDHQQHLIATVLEQELRTVGHDQEAATVWDEAVNRVTTRPLDMGWLDANLGIWFYTYYGHDETFVVDGNDRAVYVMKDGKRSDPALYPRALAPQIALLIHELRAKLLQARPINRDTVNLTPGAVDVVMFDRHPAIVSVKPIISDTAHMRQVPGHEYLHVSVRYLDGRFVQDLAQRYDLMGADYTSAKPRGSAMHSVPIEARSGETLGYFVWDPFRPGSTMFRRMLPALALALTIVFAVVVLLLRRIGRSTTQLMNARRRAQHLADHDPLTGLANRALFERRLTAQLAQLPGSGMSLALLYIDLDHFKDVNDNLGHPTGDALICAVARILSDCAGPADTVARLGGDEFAVIAISRRGKIAAEGLCQKVAQALARPQDLGDGEVLVGASIGIAMAPFDASDGVELVRKADIALYDAKSSGRRRHSFFHDEMGARVRYRHEIARDLRDAVNEDKLSIVYQPYFEARTGRLDGFEALLRWKHPVHGSIWPDVFVPIAEECGLIEVIGEWVLEQACLVAARWSVDMSVNLSAVQLRDPGLAERVYTILKRARLMPDRLELEITETSFLECDDQCRANIGRLRDIGIRIALDDFGTGYSSFRHLHAFEVDRIKIDQSFIATVDLSTGGSPVVQAIIDLARTSGIKTTAEGVETSEQLNYLSSIGCTAVQGYLLALPIPGDELANYFENPQVFQRQMRTAESERFWPGTTEI